MARPSNTAQRREQIIDGLLEVMARASYEDASVIAIGRAAGLAPSLVHYHFRTKEEVLVALVERLVAGVTQRYEARASSARDPLGRLHAFIDAHLALGRTADPRAVAAWNVVGAEALRQPEVRALYRAAIASSLGELRRLAGAALRAQARSTRNSARVAAALLAAIEGALRVGAAAPDALPRGYAAPMVRRMAEGLIRAEQRA